MSKVGVWLRKEETKLEEVVLPLVEAKGTIVAGILNTMLTTLKNPIVDGVLQTVLPPAITSRIPNIEAGLLKAITDVTAGTKIATDINAATTPDAKVKVFLTDMQTYSETGNVFQNTILLTVSKQLLGIIDNNALKQELYNAYLEIEVDLGKAA